MLKLPIIKIYGANRCHKTQYYIHYFKSRNINFQFYDVEENEFYADELRNLYENRKLNFPTIVIGTKRLRNPKETKIGKELQKLTEK